MFSANNKTLRKVCCIALYFILIMFSLRNPQFLNCGIQASKKCMNTHLCASNCRTRYFRDNL